MKLILFLISCAYADFTLNLLHLNDFHARFEETNVYSGRCSEKDKEANNCFGGVARIQSKVEELRHSLENAILLGGGDYYQGTVWYAVHKWRAMVHFLNIIHHDALVLGNHEFDDGLSGLVPFLENVTFPVIAANIDDTEEPSFQGKVPPSLVIEKEGTKIGIVGYLTTDTEFISSPGKLKITDEAQAVRDEAKKLKDEGVNIIIALGHSGYKKDMEIAKTIEDVDVVVGGHTNTFLYNGDSPSTEEKVDNYPSVVVQDSGRKVPVVQAYAYGKYLGHLTLTFDDNGEVISWEGNPILLDNSVPKDEYVLRELIPWKKELESIVTQSIGRTFVFLDGERLSCRLKECNLGNLVADSMVHQNAKYPDDANWARTSLAVVNSGGIRASIDEQAANGSITIEDVITSTPFQNTIDIVEIKGKELKEMFEHSVAKYDKTDPSGAFLQVSGFHVVYDIQNPVGSRVVKLQARCVQCRIPVMEDIIEDQVYKVAMTSFSANGGDGYSMIKNNKVDHHLTGLLDTDVLSSFIDQTSPIYQGVENRIMFRNAETEEGICYSTSSSPGGEYSTVEIYTLASANSLTDYNLYYCSLLSLFIFLYYGS